MTSGEWEYTQGSGQQVAEGAYVSKGKLSLNTVLSSACPGMAGGGHPSLEARGTTQPFVSPFNPSSLLLIHWCMHTCIYPSIHPIHSFIHSSTNPSVIHPLIYPSLHSSTHPFILLTGAYDMPISALQGMLR